VRDSLPGDTLAGVAVAAGVLDQGRDRFSLLAGGDSDSGRVDRVRARIPEASACLRAHGRIRGIRAADFGNFLAAGTPRSRALYRERFLYDQRQLGLGGFTLEKLAVLAVSRMR